MLIIAGRLIVDADERDGYVAECIAIVDKARQAPGCLDFAITADSIDHNRINVYERWASDAELEQFRGSGPDEGQTARIRDAQVKRYRISATEDA